VAELLAIAESANPSPDDPDRCGEVCLDAKDGKGDFPLWGRRPASLHRRRGRTIDFWEWDDTVPGRDQLMAWCRVGDAACLLSA
jgi:hypothetical protein